MESKKLVTVVSRVIYTHTNNWRILDTKDGTVKGTVSWDIKENDCIECSGSWGISPRDGNREFDAKTIIPSVPEDSRALLQYAAIKTTGIGEAKEELIWSAFGEDWPNHPELEGIAGIREATRFAWETTLQELETFKEQAKTIAYMLACGCTIGMSSAAWDTWGMDTMGRVIANPYDIADLPHYGFLAVDRCRSGFGISEDDPRRIREAIMFAIKQEGEKGHTSVGIADVAMAVKALVPFTDETYDDGVKKLIQKNRIVTVMDGETMYLIIKKFWDYEAGIHERYIR